MTLRVVHLVLSLDVGGLERVVLELSRALAGRGAEVWTVCLERPGTLAVEAARHGIGVRCVHKAPGIRPRTVGRLTAMFGELRPHVVHSHQLGALVYGGPAARRAGVRAVVHTEHGKFYADSRKARWLGRFATRYSRLVCGVSPEIVRDLLDFRVAAPGKVVLGVNGIDTGRFVGVDGRRIRQELGIPIDSLVVGTVGRLAEIKQQDLLIRGFAGLLDRLPGARLVLVGDGPERPRLEALSAESGIASRTTFVGNQEYPEHYLAAMDVFAITSRSEGTPLAALEAWAAGKPVVASAVGGLPDLIRDGATGLLFPAGDATALTSCLVRLALDPAARQKLGEAGRSRALSEFDVRVMADFYERHYRALLAHGGRLRLCAS